MPIPINSNPHIHTQKLLINKNKPIPAKMNNVPTAMALVNK